jgi:uncharacterized cofD-like protein
MHVSFILDNGQRVRPSDRISQNESYAQRYVVDVQLDGETSVDQVLVTRMTIESIANADVIVMGPGSLFESIIPNLLIPEIRQALSQSRAKKIYICSIMTEPG